MLPFRDLMYKYPIIVIKLWINFYVNSENIFARKSTYNQLLNICRKYYSTRRKGSYDEIFRFWDFNGFGPSKLSSLE